MTRMSDLDDLKAIGFKCVGEWRLEGRTLALDLKEMSEVSPALYSFVLDGTPMYVGKTARSLGQRLYGYLKGGGTQRTNIRVRGEINACLELHPRVEIYAFAQPIESKMGRFAMNIPAALEDDIIKELRPAWNGGGNDHSRKSPPTIRSGKQADTDRSSRNKPAQSQAGSEFSVVIGKTYFAQGFFNVPISYANVFDSDGRPITIHVHGETVPISGMINRSVNVNETPRIMGRTPLRDWFHSHLVSGKNIRVRVVNKNEIEISA